MAGIPSGCIQLARGVLARAGYARAANLRETALLNQSFRPLVAGDDAPRSGAADRGGGPAPRASWDAAWVKCFPLSAVRCAAKGMPVACATFRPTIFPTMVTVGQHEYRH